MSSTTPAITLKRAAELALECQDACNLSGVVKSLAGPIMDRLWAEMRTNGQDGDWLYQHPIVTLFLDKLASLNRSQCLCSDCITRFSKAHDAVTDLIASLSCGWQTEAGTVNSPQFCKNPKADGSIFCAEHTGDAHSLYPHLSTARESQ